MNDTFKEKIVYIKIGSKGDYAIVSTQGYKSEDEFLDSVAKLLKSGIGIIQLKDFSLNSSKLLDLACKLKNLCLVFDATFIVNDRIDIALLCNADGVHLEKNSIKVQQARELLDGHVIVGISLSQKEADNLQFHNADYILINENNKQNISTLIYAPTHKNEYQVPYFKLKT